jgi:hypothetical protein
MRRGKRSSRQCAPRRSPCSAAKKEAVAGLRSCEQESPYDTDYKDNEHDSQREMPRERPRIPRWLVEMALAFWFILLGLLNWRDQRQAATATKGRAAAASRPFRGH